MNDWVDENCFFTVGRAMLDGNVPYRDICEQKGPVVYFVFALAALVSKTSFFGVFLIEWMLFSAFLYVGSGFLRLYYKKAGALATGVFMLLVAFSVTVSISFSHGGSVEELSLVMLTLSLFWVLRAVKNWKGVSNANSALIGAFVAIALWSKFTITGFYIGLCAAYAAIMMRRKAFSALLKNMLFFFVGVFLITAPIMAYFAANGAVDSLFETYFCYNTVLYPQIGGAGFIAPLWNILEGLGTSLAVNGFSSLLLLLGAFALVRRLRAHKSEATILFFSFAMLAASTFIGGKSRFSYYALILDCFVPLGAATAVKLLFKAGLIRRLKRSMHRRFFAAALAGVLLGFGLVLSKNTYLLKYEKSDMPQYKFAETMAKKEGATLLNYGFLDGGFYFVANKTPNCKYFCKLNLALAEMDQEQRRMIEERRVDFVVTRMMRLEHMLDASGYELVETASFPLEGREFVYYLYVLKPAP